MLPRSSPPVPTASPRLGRVVFDVLRDPVAMLLRRWNWKAAALSILFRAPVYVVASLRSGWRETLTALFAESAVCAGTAGFYGAFVQAIRNAQPAWATALVLILFLPAVMQAVEYVVHWLRGTHHLQAVLMGSVVVSILSSLFNWFAMKRGTLLVGGEGKSFQGDLRRLPLLAVGFVVSGPRWLWQAYRRTGVRESSGPSGAGCRGGDLV